MGIWHYIRGTLETMFNIGGAGTAANPAWKSNAGVMESRRGDDSAFGITRGAAPVGADDYTQKAYVDAAVAGTVVAIDAAALRVANLPFGRNTAVPGAGTLQLAAPGTSLVGYRIFTAGTIKAASIQVDTADILRSYNLEIRKNAVLVAGVALVAGSTGAHTAALAVPVVAGDVITAFMVLAAGAGASTFNNETALIKVA